MNFIDNSQADSCPMKSEVLLSTCVCLCVREKCQEAVCEQKEHRMMHSNICKKPNPRSGLKNVLSRCSKGSLQREHNSGHMCVSVCVCV
jgi:hypothetical protein